jgi:hypothetical protein
VAGAHAIRSIAFDGDHLPIVALRDALATRVGDPLDRATLGHDRAALQQVLAARGYLAAVVEPGRVTLDASGGAFVTFGIATGPVFHVRSIAVTGAAAKDAGVVTIAQGDVALPDRLARERDAIATRLGARGTHAGVALEVTRDPAAAAVDVILAVR